MTLKEFVKLEPKIVRRDNDLMRLFIEFYEAAFLIKPNCAGCVFKSGFKRLKKYSENKDKNLNFEDMGNEAKTFKLNRKHHLKILSYVKKGKVHRTYGYNLTEEFARELVKFGKTDIFDKLPDSAKKVEDQVEAETETKEPETTTTIDYISMDWREEVLPLYAELKERTGEKAESTKKEDVIKFLEKHND